MAVKVKKIGVLYHAHCLDGYAAAWSAWKSLGHTADYIAVKHHTKIPEFKQGAILYIVDFCYPIAELVEASQTAAKIIVIDHHITAKQSLDDYQGVIPDNLVFHFDMQHSGCILAWQYFHDETPAPLLLAHIEDRDLWTHQLPHTDEINRALFLRQPIAFNHFEQITIDELYRDGQVLLQQQQQMVKVLVNSHHQVTLNNITGLAVNAPSAFASDLGHVLAQKSGTFGLIYHYHGKRQRYECGLRSIGDFDVGQLAVSFGGGGHKNASGFQLDKSTFFRLLNGDSI